MKLSLYCFLIAAVLPCACQETHQQQTGGKGGSDMELSLVSTAFEEGGMIPRKHTCDGADVSPALAWGSAPPGARSFALICDDPDAPMGTWVHWVIFNLPGDARALPEGVAAMDELENGATQGVNDFEKIGYGGPCPPHGTHRYFFKLYALDGKLNLDGRVTKERLLKAMEGHILGEARLMGKYKR
jgi:Raf kinase inhibitor-like YbhB/YbcL family protein